MASVNEWEAQWYRKLAEEEGVVAYSTEPRRPGGHSLIYQELKAQNEPGFLGATATRVEAVAFCAPGTLVFAHFRGPRKLCAPGWGVRAGLVKSKIVLGLILDVGPMARWPSPFQAREGDGETSGKVRNTTTRHCTLITPAVPTLTAHIVRCASRSEMVGK